MKKGILIGITFIALIIVAILLRDRAPEESHIETIESRHEQKVDENIESDPVLDVEKTATKDKEGISSEEKEQNSSKGASPYTNLTKMEEGELKDMEELYDYAEERWTAIAEKLFLDDLGLSEEVYQKYLNMREDYEEERWRAFEDFHKEMMNNPDQEVNATEYTDKVEEDITTRYQEKLQNLLGKKKYQQYLNRRHKFNEKLRKRQDPRKGMLLIDF